jgi:hypothetical protein
MLDIFRWMALFSAIVLVVAVAGAVVVSSQQSPLPTEQQAAEKNKAENPAQKSNKTLWDNWFPDSISLYTLFLVVFTAVLAIGGIYQLNFLGRAEQIAATAANAARDSAKAAKDAVELSDKTAIRQLRAYVYLRVDAHIYPPSGEIPNRYAISLVIKNSGRTWARNVHIKLARIENPVGDPFDAAELQKQKTEALVLGPGEELTLQFTDVYLTELPDLKEGTKTYVFVAAVTYEDVLTNPPVVRQTHLSRKLVADTEGVGHVSFSWMPTHNCADDDCPQ